MEFAGAVYHVIVRGSKREKISYDDKDQLSTRTALAAGDFFFPRYGSLRAYSGWSVLKVRFPE